MTFRERYEQARRLYAQHDKVCPVTDVCVKCDQLWADVEQARASWLNSRFSFFTGKDDVFRDGGTLVDVDQPWGMRDKLQHFFGGLLLARLAHILLSFVLRHESIVSRARYAITIVIMAAILNEFIEVTRMWRWWHRTASFRLSGWTWDWDAWSWRHPATEDSTLTMALPASPPSYADRMSWKDVVATVVGGLIGL